MRALISQPQPTITTTQAPTTENTMSARKQRMYSTDSSALDVKGGHDMEEQVINRDLKLRPTGLVQVDNPAAVGTNC